MPWRPSSPGEVPTLGWGVIDWINASLAHPTRATIEPFFLYPEQEEFILRFYELDPVKCQRLYRRGVLSRPRGWGKSPVLAALAIVEAMGPVVPDGWDSHGQPVGIPWTSIKIPTVQIAAVSEVQTRNTWKPLMGMLRGPVLDDNPGLEPLGTFVNLPYGGRIEPITSSARSVKGSPEVVFAVLDQTEEWVQSNGGKTLATNMINNAAKTGGYVVESPNAYTPGENSVAEDTAASWSAIREGRARDTSLYYDHREAPAETDMSDPVSLRSGLAYVYGDSVIEKGGHLDLDGIVARIWDPTLDPQVARADFLNQITHASDSWITQPQWTACSDARKALADKDVITLGFDGSIREDATALVACRVSDGFLQLLGCWEKPIGAPDSWQVDTNAVNAAVRAAFGRYEVIGMYADPAYWQGYIDMWTQEFAPHPNPGSKRRDKSTIRVKATADKPFELWASNVGRMVKVFERFHTAVTLGELVHGGDSTLSRHVLNARRKIRPAGVLIGKDHPKSMNKIDAAMAAALAYEARCDAVAQAVGAPRKKRQSARRVY